MASHRLLVTALTALALAAGTAALAREDTKKAGGVERERMAAWASKLGLNDQQQDRIHKTCEQYAERAEPVEEQLWKLSHEEFDAVKNVLTPEQREKLPEVIKAEMTREVRTVADKLGLSEEQRRKIASIREEYEPKFREVCAQSSDDARRKMRELRAQFFADIRPVLTDEQRAKVFGVLRAEFQQWRDPAARQERLEQVADQLGVTADQKAQIQKVAAEYRPKIERLAMQLKDTCHEERAAIEKVLTDEQRTKAQEMWKDVGVSSGVRSRD